MCARDFQAQSAGIEPGRLNPVAVEAMHEIGLDISGNCTKSVSGFLRQQFDYVVTVCDETSAERCPALPGATKRLHWGFPDPSSFGGSAAEKLARTREMRDAIRRRVEEWCREVGCCRA